jgi:hypothetical protein
VRTHVQFQSAKFPSTNPDPDEGFGENNPGIWGQRLAEYLRDQLRARGVKTGEPIAEDWGWRVPIEDAPFAMALCCANYTEVDEREGYLVFVTPDTPTIKRWFKKIDTRADIERVVGVLEKALSEDAEISRVQWFTADEFRGGKTPGG